tara:strand:+ start:1092 stop:1427 length:336 start_codon:yes stop_codon:yes gene_type:complete
MKTYKGLIVLISALLLVSCDSMNKATNESLKSLKDSQNLLIEKITKLEKGQLDMKKTLAALNKPAPPAKNDKKKQPPKADPNKVYDIAIGNSIIEGDPNAPITIIEWMDYQ